MWTNFFLTYLHYLSIIFVIAGVFAELFLVRKVVTKDNLKRIVAMDGVYGLASIVVVTTGLLRVYFYGKGSDYYFENSIFILKFSLFILVGLLSIFPTVTFLKLNKKQKESKEDQIEIPSYRLISNLIRIEFIILIIIPFLAILMANGIGMN
jgi:putative membrane protein